MTGPWLLDNPDKGYLDRGDVRQPPKSVGVLVPETKERSLGITVLRRDGDLNGHKVSTKVPYCVCLGETQE